MTDDQKAAVESLEICKAVQTTREFDAQSGPRVYLNLWDASARFHGDQTCKFFVDARGFLVYEPGKGTRSDDFRASVAMLLEHAESLGITVRKV